MLVPNIHVVGTDILVRLMKWRTVHVNTRNAWTVISTDNTVNGSEKWEDPSTALREARIIAYTTDQTYVQLMLMLTSLRLSGDQGLEYIWVPVDEVIVKSVFPAAPSQPKPRKAKR